MSSETRRLAALHGDRCGGCSRAIEPGDPVTLSGRLVRLNVYRWREHQYPICRECTPRLTKHMIVYHNWVTRACEGCGREVWLAWRRNRRYTSCSQRCTDMIRNKVRRKHHWPTSCGICDRTFTPRRTDSQYCSNTCRQKAYRQREKAV